MELVEPPQGRVHFDRSFVGFGDEHHQGVHRVPSRAHEQLERVVETRGITAFRPDDGLQALDALAPYGCGQGRLARPHRIAVPPQRVDLAVVGEHAERLGQRPARRRVRRIALVKDRDRRLEIG